MSKKVTIWLITATFLVIIGCMIFGGVMMSLKWDIKKLSTVKYETNSYKITEKFKNISLKTDTADIKFVPSADGVCKVICYENKKMKHAVESDGETLNIDMVDTRKWYDYISFFAFSSPKMTVYLPDDEYGALYIDESTGDIEIPENLRFESMDIKVSTGDIKNNASVYDFIRIKGSTGNVTLKEITAKSIEISLSTGNIIADKITCDDIKNCVSTGDVKLSDINCKSVVSEGSTGDIILKNVIASENFSIKRSTGNVKFEKCDAKELDVETSTGNITGSLLSDKIFMANSSTGKIQVPETAQGGKCKMTANTGDIKIEIAN